MFDRRDRNLNQSRSVTPTKILIEAALTRRISPGLVFGYSADAIQRFILSAPGARASKSRGHPCMNVYRHRRVEIYGPLVQIVRRRNSRNGKFPKSR
jgi:hypothetical protein